jgi:hypothetical protein
MTYQIGDTRRPTLTIKPYDGSTVVTLTVVCVATAVSAATALTGPVPGPNSGEGVWTSAAPYTFTSPGTWIEQWRGTNVVTGIGAGAENVTLEVEATPPALGPGQTAAYATVTQYANIIGGTIPTNLARLLRIASRQLDDLLFSSIYDSTSAATLLILAEATCEQVAYMGANGWWTSGGVASVSREVSIGSAKIGAPSGSSGGAGVGTIPRISPTAYSLLVNAGLVGGQPDTFAGYGWWL